MVHTHRTREGWIMQKFTVALSAVAAGTAVWISAAPVAAADDPILPVAGNGSASDGIQQLQSAGYNVSINWLEGHPNVPLRECKIDDISGLGATTSSGFDTVYVDVECPNAK
jgi:hypothetical protein